MTPRDFDEWLENHTLLDFLDEEEPNGNISKFPLVSRFGMDAQKLLKSDLDTRKLYKGHALISTKEPCPHGYTDTFICFDFETTDKLSDRADIVDIGAIKVVNGEIVDEFQTLVLPEKKITAGAYATHGISREYLIECGAPSTAEALEQFLAFIGSPDIPLLGHNAETFDSWILWRGALKHLDRIVKNDIIDTLRLTQRYFGHAKVGTKLEELCQRFRIENKNAHRALSDAYATLELYKILRPILLDDDSYYTDLVFGSLEPEDVVERMQLFLNDSDNVVLRKNKTSTQIYMFDSVAFSIVKNTKQDSIETDCSAAAEYIGQIKEADSSRMAYSIPMVTASKSIPAIYNLIRAVYEYYRDAQTGEPFACCNDYILCSDARECIHKNNPDLRGCYYRKNLDRGRIIYGKNKNWPPEKGNPPAV